MSGLRHAGSLSTSTGTWYLAGGQLPLHRRHAGDERSWWGSYQNWTGNKAPSAKPASWRIAFWSNAKADSRYAFSRPDKLLWVVSATADRVQEERAGVGRIPQDPSDTVFRYGLNLKSAEYFNQDRYVDEHPGPRVLDQHHRRLHRFARPAESVGLEDPAAALERRRRRGRVPSRRHPGGIRARSDHGPADRQLAAVRAAGRRTTWPSSWAPIPSYIKWEQAFTGLRDWPYYEDEQSHGRARARVPATKWTQQPDVTSAGVDVDFTKDLPPTWPTTICADDFECKSDRADHRHHPVGFVVSRRPLRRQGRATRRSH